MAYGKITPLCYRKVSPRMDADLGSKRLRRHQTQQTLFPKTNLQAKALIN